MTFQIFGIFQSHEIYSQQFPFSNFVKLRLKLRKTRKLNLRPENRFRLNIP